MDKGYRTADIYEVSAFIYVTDRWPDQAQKVMGTFERNKSRLIVFCYEDKTGLPIELYEKGELMVEPKRYTEILKELKRKFFYEKE